MQTYTCLVVPLTIAFTRFTLGFQGRLERRWEWETWIPKATPLSQNSHLAIRLYLLAGWNHAVKNGMYDFKASGYMIPDTEKKCKGYFQKPLVFLSKGELRCCQLGKRLLYCVLYHFMSAVQMKNNGNCVLNCPARIK
ncbi:hypothetical protein SDC9_152278 [bioreactor metagenome]|uniref:Uncharacterized protein n=1 Tax=bioreactor metagenome TaxID=1076179 RepID=A0A645EV02_9ZZZZ